MYFCLQKTMSMRHFYIFLTVLIGSVPAFSQVTAIVSEGLFQIDETRNLILVNQDLEGINAQNSGSYFSKIELDKLYNLSENVVEFEYGVSYEVTDPATSENYKLNFTKLPIISIVTEYEIVDEPRVPAHFFMSEPDGNITDEFIGIEYRGGFSQSFPKKSMRIEFVTEEGGDEEKDVSLLGLREDGDWNIQAMFNEPLRFNNVVSFEIWDEINTLYYAAEEPEAINGVRMKYVEVFLKGGYMGVYGLGERVDRKQLKLKKIKNGLMKGELYKGVNWDYATLFLSAPSYNNNSDYWAGFELQYPKPEEMIDWKNLHDFISFAVESSNEEFYSEYENRLVSDNFIDYYIFLNLLRAGDNTGKNIFLAKYTTDEPYFIVPWDLDGTFGIWWDGSQTGTVDDNLSNNLYERLIADCTEGGFSERMKNRWAVLRQNEITFDHISGKFQQKIDYLSENGAYEREYTRWHGNGWYYFPEGDPTDFIQEKSDYFNGWLQDRLDYLDVYFPTLCPSMGTVENQKSLISVYPNPVFNELTVNSEKSDRFKIFGLSGQKVMEGTLVPGINKFDFSGFAPGVYLLISEKGEKVKILKK